MGSEALRSLRAPGALFTYYGAATNKSTGKLTLMLITRRWRAGGGSDAVSFAWTPTTFPSMQAAAKALAQLNCR